MSGQYCFEADKTDITVGGRAPDLPDLCIERRGQLRVPTTLLSPQYPMQKPSHGKRFLLKETMSYTSANCALVVHFMTIGLLTDMLYPLTLLFSYHRLRTSGSCFSFHQLHIIRAEGLQNENKSKKEVSDLF